MDETVEFTRMADGSYEDYQLLARLYEPLVKRVPDEVIAMLDRLAGDKMGYKVDRYEHSLQTATRAYRDGADEETVVCALLHDIGDTLAPENHAQLAAAVLRPYVSDDSHWLIQHHGIFQGAHGPVLREMGPGLLRSRLRHHALLRLRADGAPPLRPPAVRLRKLSMSIEHWLAFALASAVLVAIPGPTVLLVISYALGHGRKSAAATVAGVTLGDFTAMTASMLGLGAFLAASATLFTALKLIGAAYLVYMGLRLWRAPVGILKAGEPAETDARRIFGHAYVVTALNPKSIVFFIAFLPQFLSARGPLLPQMLALEATFLALATLNATAYGLAASAARRTIRKPAVQRAVNRVGGSFLIGAGLLAAGWRKASS